jgi:hypothetical protein
LRSCTLTVTAPGIPAEISAAPDKVFALEFTDLGRRNYFLLEADRSKMPILRSSFEQSSFKKKLLVYHHAHKAGLHKTSWNIPGFRVLTITRSAERIASMLVAVNDITDGRGSGVFLFAKACPTLFDDPLDFAWTSAKVGVASLLPPP